MTIYIVTREETNVPFVVFSPFATVEKARALVDAHTSFRVGNGEKYHRKIDFTPSHVEPGTKVRVGGSESRPIDTDAPDCICCVISEVEIITRTGGRAIYRVTQHPVTA